MFPNLEFLFNNFEKLNEKLSKIITNEHYNKMSINNNWSYINQLLLNYEKLNIKIVTILSEKYSKLLKEIPLPPTLLYCKGNIELLNTPCLAVVGTRRCTKYGREITQKFINEIARNGITIVSGMADGIDTVAHNSALECNGNTIAVVASGFNYIYPANNKKLFEQICDKGLVVSEYKPTTKIETYHFPQRNRIIAGLSSGTLITEAPEKSGSMITKDMSLEYNRDIYAIPGRLTDIYSTGTNSLIKNFYKCMVLTPGDILKDFNITCPNLIEQNQIMQLNIEEQQIINAIKNDTLHFEEIQKLTNMETKKLNTILGRLQLRDIIKKYAGNYFSK